MKKQTKRTGRLMGNPVFTALRRAKPVAPDVVTKLRIIELSTLEAFAQDQAEASDLEVLQQMERLARCSVELGVGPEVLAACDDAAPIIQQLVSDAAASVPLQLDTTQLEVMRELQKMHDQQRELVSFGDYLKIVGMADELMKAANSKELA